MITSKPARFHREQQVQQGAVVVAPEDEAFVAKSLEPRRHRIDGVAVG